MSITVIVDITSKFLSQCLIYAVITCVMVVWPCSIYHNLIRVTGMPQNALQISILYIRAVNFPDIQYCRKFSKISVTTWKPPCRVSA